MLYGFLAHTEKTLSPAAGEHDILVDDVSGAAVLCLIIIMAHGTGKVARANHANLNRNRDQTEDVLRRGPDFINQSGSGFVLIIDWTLCEFHLHAEFTHRPFGITPHDAEAVRPHPFERLLFPLNGNTEGSQAQ